jgi:hypothetical protein
MHDNLGIDVAPAQSPVPVTGIPLIANGRIEFQGVSGTVSYLVNNFSTCDGKRSVNFTHIGSTHGLSDLPAPGNSLVGVFLGPNRPNPTGTPASMLSFGTSASRTFATLSPALEQPFFIGDGLTVDGGNGKGSFQDFVVPAGATRLYLATMDSHDWNDNSGKCVVQNIATLP